MEIENGILEKIQKLLRLQKGAEAIGSLEEAENAASKAQTLLLKYNLDLEDVTGHLAPDKTQIQRFDEKEIINPKNEGKWVHALYNVLCKNNFCKLIVISRGIKDYACLIGTKDNVTSVKFLAEQVENRIRIAEKNGWKRNVSSEKRNAFRRGFFMGAVMGIDAKLKEQREREAQANVKVTALVLSRDSKLKDFIQSEFNNLRQAKSSRLSAQTGRNMGYEEGRNMNINRGVEGGGNKRYLPQ